MELNLKTAKEYTFAFCIIGLIMVIPNTAAADPPAGGDAISGVLCIVVKALTGPIGKAIATIAIVVLGIGLFMGKLSWPLALATALGIGMIFGADQIVTWLAPAAKSSCT
jgi:type IV secretory pathway VirB2 component (pilin)